MRYVFFLWTVLVLALVFVAWPAQAKRTPNQLPVLKKGDAEDLSPDAVTQDQQQLGGVAGGVQRLGEQVASRVDKVIRKKAFELWGDPWMMQGLPLIFPSSQDGFNLGLKVAIQNIARQDPDKLEIEAQVLASDKGRYKHFLRVDVPHAFDGQVRITGRIAYDRDISLKYFGIGNETSLDTTQLTNSPLYQNVTAGPSLSLDVLRYIGKSWRLGPVFRLKWTQVTAPAGSLLAQQQPAGVAGGRSHTLGFAIVHDTLDWEPYPSRGGVNELYLQLASSFTGSDYNFFRATYTYRRYHLLNRRLILAHRTLIETLTGNVPYYELDAVGGSNGSLAFGGDKYLRGFEANRFIDHIRVVFGFELRWDPLFFPFAKQDITVGFVPFFDIGRVWSTVFPIQANHWHATAGWGARVIWNSRFIIRTDFAVTDEGASAYVTLNNSF